MRIQLPSIEILKPLPTGEWRMTAKSRLGCDTRPLLILDLDETLIFGAAAELDRPAEFRVGSYYVYERPHLAEFLAKAATFYNLAIWSSGSVEYVEAIAEKICPRATCWQFVWGRERCTPHTYFNEYFVDYIKDLKKVKRLGYDLEHILVVDDTESKLCRNFGNAIYVAPFFGDSHDNELPPLVRYLESIRSAENYRLIEKRGWRADWQRNWQD